MRVALGTFACSGIEAHLGADIPAAVQAALSHYTSKLKAGRQPVAVPQFLGSASRDSEVAFELPVDAETEAVLEKEAERQGTSVSQLAVHSVLIYLAELDFLAVPPRAGATAPRML